MGIDKSFLISEWEKAKIGIQTKDCREICSSCGVCKDEVQTKIAQGTFLKEGTSSTEVKKTFRQNRQYKYRVFYQKKGLLRFIAHLDWMRMLFAAFL